VSRDRARRFADWWWDRINIASQVIALVGLTLAGAWLLASDGPPWPVGVVGLVVALAAVFVSVARCLELRR
jgi:putative effector of murein hydrolase LrgA (UPF0299 family)